MTKAQRIVADRSGGPYDQRLARLIARGLAHLPVTPNQLTFVSLAFGVAAGVLFALGDRHLVHWAAAMSVLAIFSDHIDGELARMTGRTSAFGHKLDYIVGSANYTMLFAGIGIGLGSGLAGELGGSLGLGVPDHWYLELGIRSENLILRPHDADELSHYSSATSDIEYLFISDSGTKHQQGAKQQSSGDTPVLSHRSRPAPPHEAPPRSRGHPAAPRRCPHRLAQRPTARWAAPTPLPPDPRSAPPG